MRHRRVWVPNATCFFTMNLQDRKSDALTRHIHALRLAFRTVKVRHPFRLNAIVVMPEHCHFIMTLQENDLNFSMRIALIKATFSRQLTVSENISFSRRHRRERGIWQRRFWDHVIRDEKDYMHHVHYIHFNPVKHGYVQNPHDWPYSSIHRFITDGALPANWACDGDFGNATFGE
ncbi:transposase [Legionella geestiana]|uniref:REP-associated tyrosine transposase n=1 Tax=Legionella geestiana TaxID=45065 RepID=UPI0010932484|nr:transposase [Legionella geestiana]QDQ39894.1 transposase [Legionella geestiana]